MSDLPGTATGQNGSVKHLGLLALLLNVLIRPRTAFANLRDRAGWSWWLPALLALATLAALVLVEAPITARLGQEQLRSMQEQMEEQPMMGGSSPEQFQQAIALTTSPLVTIGVPIVTGLLGLLLGWLIQSGVFHLAAMALGGRSRFGHMFTAVVWAGLPYALRNVVQAIGVALSGQPIQNQGLSGLVQPAVSSMEQIFTAPPSMGQIVLSTFLARIDVWAIWAVLLSIVAVYVTARTSKGRAVVIGLGYWLLVTLVALIPAVLGSMAMTGFGG